MNPLLRICLSVIAALAVGVSISTHRTAFAQSFRNTSPITVADREGVTSPPGVADRYPAQAVVSGIAGAITDLNVTLNALSSERPDDLDILLVSPEGQSIILMADAGGDAPVSRVNLTFDDDASSLVPDEDRLTTDSFRPAAHDLDFIFPSPAPPQAFAATLSAFDGTDPNGTWSLFVIDDERGAISSIAGGFTLTITANADPGQFSFDSAPVSIGENTSGGGALRLTVVRTNGASGDVTVPFTVADGTATFGTDYNKTGGRLVFADGETVGEISIPILDDAVAEEDETFVVTLGAPGGGATLGSPASVTVTIRDNDRPCAICISEFRLSGAAGVNDSFVEIYNNTDEDQDIGGFAVISFDPQAGFFEQGEAVRSGEYDSSRARSLPVRRRRLQPRLICTARQQLRDTRLRQST